MTTIAQYKQRIKAMPTAEIKSLATVFVAHNRDNPWDKAIITLLHRELDVRRVEEAV